MADGRTYYLDVTDILKYASHNSTVSGIQRVTLNVIGQLVAKHGPSRIRLVGYHPKQRKVLELDSSWCSPDYRFDQMEFQRWFRLGGGYGSIREWSRIYKHRPLRRSLHRLRAYLSLIAGRRKFFEKRGISVPGWMASGGDRIVGDFEPNPGDRVVILGATWEFPEYINALVAQKQAKRFEVLAFVHDLIPVKAPAYVAEGMSDAFRNWLDSVYRMADRLVANSGHTASDLRADMAQRGLDIPVATAPLAHEFLTDKQLSTPLRVATLYASERPYVLFVGTIESRKNVWGLLRAWKALAEDLKLDTPYLVLAGKEGWGIEDFRRLYACTGALDGLVTLVDRPTDAELAHLYGNCLFTVFPSHYEGWGLPIGESLWFGKTCVASNTSSMPEVGGDMCAYVDPKDLTQLFNELKRMVTDQDYRVSFEHRIHRKRLRTWSDFADSLYAAVDG